MRRRNAARVWSATCSDHGREFPRAYTHARDVERLAHKALDPLSGRVRDRIFYAATRRPLVTAGQAAEIVKEHVPGAEMEILPGLSDDDRMELRYRGVRCHPVVHLDRESGTRSDVIVGPESRQVDVRYGSPAPTFLVRGTAEVPAKQGERRRTVTRPCTTIDEYISAFPDDVRSILQQVRRTARNAAPAAGEAISYGIPTITLNGRDLVSFAAWKNHIGLYPIPVVDDAFAQELAPYRAAKSTVRFPLSKPIPYDLIERLVVLHVQQRLDSEQ